MSYKAFILGAGFGTRLRPVSDRIPKPMVFVNGRSLLWRCLDNLRAFGVREVVVNAHYLSSLIKKHMDDYMRVFPEMRVYVSIEEGILDTGGGVSHALDFFDDDAPFFVIAGDNLWTDEKGGVDSGGKDIHTYTHALEVLAQGWDAQKMDVFTLMQPVSSMSVTRGVGDYALCPNGHTQRSLDKTGTHMWTNIRLNHPRIYKDIKKDVFSFLDLMDECEARGRLYAIEHEGEWHHISTPEDLAAVDAYINSYECIRKSRFYE